MGVGQRAKSFGEFSAKAGLYAKVGIPQANMVAVRKVAQMVESFAEASIAMGSGGDSVLSNVGRRKELRGAGSRARVGVRSDIKGEVNPTALIRATGPLHLLDNPTNYHLITARGYRLSRAKKNRDAVYNAIFGGVFSGPIGSSRRATPMATPYGPRMYVRHPGTAGKRTFWRGVDRAKPFIPQTYRGEYAQQMRRFWQ